MPTGKSVAIIGGGPGGLMLARLLLLRNEAVVVFERDPSANFRPQGGSLDLHPDTGLRAMHLAGLQAEFEAAARPEDQGDRLYDAGAALLLNHGGGGGDRPEIDRAMLRAILLNSLPPGLVRWNSRVEEVSSFHGEDGFLIRHGDQAERFDIVVGADGAWSRVRPLVSSVAPTYEGVAFVELEFNRSLHPPVDALVGAGKMFAVGDERIFIGQRNGRGLIRGYLGRRLGEDAALDLCQLAPDLALKAMLEAFREWSPKMVDAVRRGAPLGARPVYALPIGHRWISRPGVTLLGDAAHLMSPFAGEGVNLALADAADLAEALSSGDGSQVALCEAKIAQRAEIAARRSSEGLQTAFSKDAPARLLKLYRERISARRPDDRDLQAFVTDQAPRPRQASS